jgi:hypothetical protein
MIDKTTIRILLVAGILIFILYIAEPDIPMFDMPPHIRNLVWIIFIIAGFLLVSQYIRPKKPPASPSPLPGHERSVNDEISGIVLDYGYNRIGDIDKILLQQSNRKMWLHFPPHTASRVMNIGIKTTTVTVTIRPSDKPSPDSLPEFAVVSIQSPSLGKVVFIHDIPPPPPEKGDEVEVTGHEVQFRLDEQGKVSAFILSDKIVELNPATGETLVSLLRQAKDILVKGYERSLDKGFVNTTGLVLVKPYSIRIDQTNYLLP